MSFFSGHLVDSVNNSRCIEFDDVGHRLVARDSYLPCFRFRRRFKLQNIRLGLKQIRFDLFNNALVSQSGSGIQIRANRIHSRLEFLIKRIHRDGCEVGQIRVSNYWEFFLLYTANLMPDLRG